jgi:hypothetical protein
MPDFFMISIPPWNFSGSSSTSSALDPHRLISLIFQTSGVGFLVPLRLRSSTLDTAGWQCALFRFGASMRIAAYPTYRLLDGFHTKVSICMKSSNPRPKRVSAAMGFVLRPGYRR